MANEISADICVIGGGSGGLLVAAGASQMGAEVVLFEPGKMGGDCLNYGCVPSKSMIAAAHAAPAARGEAERKAAVGLGLDILRSFDRFPDAGKRGFESGTVCPGGVGREE